MQKNGKTRLPVPLEQATGEMKLVKRQLNIYAIESNSPKKKYREMRTGEKIFRISLKIFPGVRVDKAPQGQVGN